MNKIIESGTHLFLVMLCLLTGISLLVSVVVPFVEYGAQLPPLSLAAGAGCVLLLAMLIRAALRTDERIFDARWLWGIVSVSAAIKILLVLGLPDYVQLSDRRLLKEFVEYLAVHGLNFSSLQWLSRNVFDYDAFSGRIFPLALPLRWIFGGRSVPAFQFVGVALSTGSLILLYRLARRLLPPRAARAAFILYAFFPLHLGAVMDYSYKVQTEFFLMLCVLWMIEISLAEQSGRGVWLKSLGTGLSMFMLHLQGGVDQLIVLLLVLVLLFGLARDRTWRGVMRKAVFLVLIPVLINTPLAKSFDAWRNAPAAEAIKSGSAGFMVHGWSIETRGVYDADYEQMDLQAPLWLKTRLMHGVILSQLKYNLPGVMFRLLPQKMAQYFLAGYASEFEESLRTGGPVFLEQIFLGMRLFFAPVFLAAVVIGCLSLLSGRVESDGLRLLLFMPVITCGIIVLLAAVSPNYSFVVHFALCIAAGMAFVPVPPGELIPRLKTAGIRLMYRAPAVLILYFAAVSGAGLAAAGLGDGRVFRDMRLAEASASWSDREAVTGARTGSLRPFLQDLRIPPRVWSPGDAVTGSLALQINEAANYCVSIHILPAGDWADGDGFVCEVRARGQIVESFPMNTLKKLKRVQCMLAGGDVEKTGISVSVVYRGDKPSAMVPPGAGILWGYLFVAPVPPGGL